MHRSVATHINRGDYLLVNPDEYEAWTANRDDDDTSEIWIRRRL